MRTGLAFVVLMAALVVAATVVQAVPATAQEVQRPTVRGLFGERTLGQPLQPKSSTRFSAVNQRSLLGTPNQAGGTPGTMFATPWRRGEPASLQMLWGAPLQFGQVEPTSGASIQPQPLAAPAVPMQPAQLPQYGQPQYGQLPQDVQPAQQPGGQFQEGQLLPSGGGDGAIGTPAAAGAVGSAGEGAAAATAPSGGSPMLVRRVLSGWPTSAQPGSQELIASATALKPQPAPELSAKITRLARAGGVQSPSGIEVTMLGTTAIVQGTVASEHQRALVANLVRLEPGVWEVENRLTVAAGQPETPR